MFFSLFRNLVELKAWIAEVRSQAIGEERVASDLYMLVIRVRCVSLPQNISLHNFCFWVSVMTHDFWDSNKNPRNQQKLQDTFFGSGHCLSVFSGDFP